MNVQDKIHGFTVTAKRELAELHATLWEMVYAQNGAQLVWLEREDNNKTFAVAFKTIPEDDTGVFHILEHSVLCGSDKFPTKEPFVELLKGSLQTFLNAFTFPDKTMYPVSSRSDRDFLNLTDVYMDAVLHPAITRKPEIFRQEGWHYAFDENGEPMYNGVVFNEMKGAYADADTLAYHALNRILFPDTGYGYSSGGDPVHIPELTYEKFLAQHSTYYHPSNARIFLDGAVPLDDTLSLLDSYLRPYTDKKDIPVLPFQTPVKGESTVSYEIAPDADPEGQLRLCYGYICGQYSDRERLLATAILADVLCGSNEAPLKKAVLSAGLAEDVALQSDDGTLQPLAVLQIRNLRAENEQAVRDIVQNTLQKLAKDGIDREQLTASLNSLEFKARARDFGSYPPGLVFAMSAMESWLYGGDPAQNLCCDEVFASLRNKLDSRYFEELLTSLFLENPHCAVVRLVPDPALGEEKHRQECTRLAAVSADWTQAQREELMRQEAALLAAQEMPDTPEQLATLPRLTPADVEPQPETLPLEVVHIGGCEVLLHGTETDGIAYAELYFSAAGLSEEELSLASFLCDVLGSAATARHSRLSLQNAIRTHLGDLSVSMTALTRRGSAHDAVPYVTVGVSLLESKKAEAISLIGEILGTSQLDDAELLRQLLRQRKLDDEEALTAGGHRFAITRASAACSAEGVLTEYIDGFENCLWIRRTEEQFDEKKEDLFAALSALCKRLFTRERLTLSVTGARDEAFCRALTATVPMSGQAVPPTAIAPLPPMREGILIPSEVAYAVEAAHLDTLGGRYSGTLRVAAKLLSLDYLWNTVRVKGGAYGTGFIARPNGMVAMYSYRDPHPDRSLAAYTHAAEYLESFCAGADDLTPYIIGAVADTDPLLSPHMRGLSAAMMHLTGKTQEDRCRLRREILSVTREELRGLCALLRRMAEVSAVCVVGGKNGLDSCGGTLTARRSLRGEG